ncbi:aldehyde dehydrogenase (NADP(+)) [Burkholderia sp. WAC0059]|uniref:aldehyde dehydrogenase (NADP(+)) n=1 Tax=Burkholderia sp. WAC0059 TaxID=2066022 RepID=UPI000C7E8DF8|nr:aldehyde dehydrogenase (NADP(+)) [Burkholderia sp. WAC0059]PLZ01572.1 aldehyde dehydrogenase (NADP(+)) [Burkholderia sp. WAC0059]
MQISGEMIEGRRASRGGSDVVYALNAASGEQMEPGFGMANEEDVARACLLAEVAFDSYRQLPDERRAAFLEVIAEEVLALGEVLIDRANLETGLPKARLENERARAVGQLRLFANVVRSGRWHGAVLDSALPQRNPLPRPDLRQRRIAVGPVAVFGASNFPLAFSVAGGDTASAFAAGCPVVVKAHRAHLGTSELVGKAIQNAVIATDMPDGIFSLLYGDSYVCGEALVRHPAIRAVGFTGSRRGGLALMQVAQARLEPIPVYAEMSSINPVFLLPNALALRVETIAKDFVASLTVGAGQFCTNPGIVIAIEGEALDVFCRHAGAALGASEAATMLTPDIHEAYCRSAKQLNELPGVEVVAHGKPPHGRFEAHAVLFRTSAEHFLAELKMHEEMFGPASLIVSCRDTDQMRLVAECMSGQLTATLHYESGDENIARTLLSALERKAGRILFNGFPTGVEVSYAMVHGGPFPATSDSRTTSVGASAIERFLRPVCYQDVPDKLLPLALQEANPLGIWRLVDGEFAKV